MVAVDLVIMVKGNMTLTRKVLVTWVEDINDQSLLLIYFLPRCLKSSIILCAIEGENTG